MTQSHSDHGEQPALPSGEIPSSTNDATMEWGSDAIAQTVRDLGIEYISLNPGASFRGFHDSLVNYLGNQKPQMLVSLHEEHAVAIAHGYAKVTDRPMAVALHSNVGLMHASMAIFNAYCDRVPMLMIGATGPVDANLRRPWIDWLHTTADQAALIRPFIKWDDQPGSPEAAVLSMARAYMLTASRPSAPTYVCLDFSVQEARLSDGFVLPDAASARPPAPAEPGGAVVRDVVRILRAAARPLFLVGRMNRNEQAWLDRVALAEEFGAEVLTHQKLGAAFPTNHPLHRLGPASHRSPDALEAMRNADVILSLDWLDLGGMLRSAGLAGERSQKVISVSNDLYLHNGWSKDSFEFPRVDINIPTEPDVAVRRILEEIGNSGGARRAAAGPTAEVPARKRSTVPREDQLTLDDILDGVVEATRDRAPSYIRLPSAWPMERMVFSHPLDYLGCDGGEGIGSGPGMAVGGALALRGSKRLPVAILGDGDYTMGVSALWNAAHYALPMLMIVANNGSYLNDEIHQDHIAKLRDRPRENRWIGLHMTNPTVDLAGMARAQGVEGLGPITTVSDLQRALGEALEHIDAGKPVVIDVRIGVDMHRAPRIVEDTDPK